ncbi:hypothetical protein Cri9333_1733 [Crinalium epipsammum PCC 9333]|uniref:HTH cro/C1-type domain-containing protein n=1 Tax=Crinalium epipsammum PCC 9333 TaxID=1173022 RepID=K9VWZ4_9CYAN|nr:hypothetical protein [Crinalium epipsammum]AFZ12618.1 hypothetical protein Cri9333_1733 [Crinalium epipsammum PCC 9333]
MKRRKSLEETDSFLEILRIEFTDYTQDEFIFRCGFSRSTYYRLMKSEPVEIKLSLEQIGAICRLCKIPLRTLFERLGIDLTGIPIDKENEANREALSAK